MTSEWTPEEARQFARELNSIVALVRDKNHPWVRNAVQAAQHLHNALDILEAQQRELEAAREVVDSVRALDARTGWAFDPNRVVTALERYDAARARQEEGDQ